MNERTDRRRGIIEAAEEEKNTLRVRIQEREGNDNAKNSKRNYEGVYNSSDKNVGDK